LGGHNLSAHDEGRADASVVSNSSKASVRPDVALAFVALNRWALIEVAKVWMAHTVNAGRESDSSPIENLTDQRGDEPQPSPPPDAHGGGRQAPGSWSAWSVCQSSVCCACG